MRSTRTSLVLAFLAVGSLAPALATPPSQPVAPVHPVVTDYYGTKVADPYRWMEKSPNPTLDKWVRAQNDYTRDVLANIPGRDELLKDIQKSTGVSTSVYNLRVVNDTFFYMKNLPGQNIPTLNMRKGIDGKERVLVDPDALSHGGNHYSINYYMPSFNGHYVAYGLAENGTEKSVLHVLDTRTGKQLDEAIDRVEADDESKPVAWRPDGKSFFYYRQRRLGPDAAPSDKFLKSRVYLHVIGKHLDGNGDKPVFGYAVNRSVKALPIQDAYVYTTPSSDYAFGILARNEDQDHVEALYAAPIKDLGVKADPWRQIATKPDDVRGMAVHGDTIYLRTSKDAPNYKVIATSIRHPDIAGARVVVPNSNAVINAIMAGRDGLYVDAMVNGLGRVDHIDYRTGRKTTLPLPYQGTVADLVPMNDAAGAYVELMSWTQSPMWYRYDAATNKLAVTKLRPPSPVDMSGIESREVEAVSYDGTLVPMSIVMAKGTKLDGKNPTLLWGYGAYGINQLPSFIASYLPWFKRGGIFALAHVRGSGVKGDAWHKAGMKGTKINTILDFIACAHYLIDHRYTSPAYLAGQGGSAGGIAVGGAITWAPQLFAAALDNVGTSDTLRAETTANGPPNIVEFGSTKTRKGFHALYAMSPYEHVHKGSKYPAVLLTTGANDPRVNPWMVYKMTARLQAATASDRPILLRVDYEAGHGIGSTLKQYQEEKADEWAFLLWQFGVPGFQPER